MPLVCSSLDVAYVSSLSLYFMCFFGMRCAECCLHGASLTIFVSCRSGIYTLLLGGNGRCFVQTRCRVAFAVVFRVCAVAFDDQRIMQQQMSGAAAMQQQDTSKIT